ncbi:MAG: hypothetical protein V3S33_06030 [Gammaproteobacteria bacterium]
MNMNHAATLVADVTTGKNQPNISHTKRDLVSIEKIFKMAGIDVPKVFKGLDEVAVRKSLRIKPHGRSN